MMRQETFDLICDPERKIEKVIPGYETQALSAMKGLRQLREIHTAASKILQSTESAAASYNELLTFLESPDPDDISIDSLILTMNEEMDNSLARCRTQLLNIYASLGYASFTRDGYDSAGTSNTEEYGISARLDGDKILIRLLLLGSAWRSSGKKKCSTLHYGSFFAKEVNAAVRRTLDGKAAEEIELFRFKTITYFFVFRQDNGHIMDSDNHDTKAVTDSICRNLPSTDSGKTTSFFYTTCVSAALPEGTYIVVSPGTFSPQPASILDRFAPII